MIKGAQLIAESFCNKKWIIYTSKDKYFATSDTPVSFGNPNESISTFGPAHPTNLVLCPLNKYLLIAMRPYFKSDGNHCDFIDADSKMIDLINQIVCLNSQRFVYFPEKSDNILEYIKKYCDHSQKLRAYKLGEHIILKWDIV